MATPRERPFHCRRCKRKVMCMNLWRKIAILTTGLHILFEVLVHRKQIKILFPIRIPSQISKWIHLKLSFELAQEQREPFRSKKHVFYITILPINRCIKLCFFWFFQCICEICQLVISLSCMDNDNLCIGLVIMMWWTCDNLWWSNACILLLFGVNCVRMIFTMIFHKNCR